MLPHDTRSGFVTVELPDELLVYDRGRNRAHCLNRTAARVWRLWDGHRSIPEIADELSVELRVVASEDLVRLAVDRLRTAGLLDGTAPAPTADFSRREMLRRLRRAGELALLLPAVATASIGGPAMAASAEGPGPRGIGGGGGGSGAIAGLGVIPALFFIPGCRQAWRFLDFTGRTNRPLGDVLTPVSLFRTPGPAGTASTPELTPGQHRLAGIRFKIEPGVLQLRSRRLLDFADQIVSIPVGHSFEMLYLLHGSAGRPAGGNARIGSYRVHYADGEQLTIPVDYGQDVQDLSLDPLPADGLPRGRVAWRSPSGTTSASGEADIGPGLFLSTWENPRRRKKVKSIDYVSEVTEAAPFCAAITTAWCVDRDDKDKNVPTDAPPEKPNTPEPGPPEIQ